MQFALSASILLFCLLNWHYVCGDLMDLLTEATCAARCFKLFTKSLTGPDKIFLRERPDLTQPHCINQKGLCALCLDVCQWPRAKTTHCDDSCKSVQSSDHPVEIRQNVFETCSAACTFARDQYTLSDSHKWGQLAASCPQTESWPSTCGISCQSDADCARLELSKCCPIAACAGPRTNRTLGHFCTSGIVPTGDVPRIPGQPTIRQVESIPNETDQEAPGSQNQLEIDWLTYYNRTEQLGPVVFLVQLRQFHDPEFAVDLSNITDRIFRSNLDRFFDSWRSLVWTTKLGAVLSDLKPGTWYQFRLLAISEHGYGGWSQPSIPIRMLTRPIPPSPPRNLTEMKVRIVENQVDLTIAWDPPKTGNLPLKKYQISWSKYYGFNGEDRSSLTEYEANVPGDKHLYTIQGLPPATAFKIQVKAVSIFEHHEFTSHPASLYIKTPHLPPRQITRELPPDNHNGALCHCNDRAASAIRIGEPYWDNMELKARLFVSQDLVRNHVPYVVEWYPKVCIETMTPNTRGTYAPQKMTLSDQLRTTTELGNLNFQCHYKLTITERPTLATKPKAWSACFCTPSCHQVTVVTGSGPHNCTDPIHYEPLDRVKLTYKLISSTDPKADAFNGRRAFDHRRSENRPRIKRTSKVNVEENFHAMVSWVSMDAQVNKPLLGKKQAVRGVRVTWGPRLYEPVQLEAYHQGLEPLIDPERVQSKVLESRMSSVLLPELQPETLYIVTVQLIGERMDGPTSRIFFAIPTRQTRTNTGTRMGPISRIATLLIFLWSYQLV